MMKFITAAAVVVLCIHSLSNTLTTAKPLRTRSSVQLLQSDLDGTSAAMDRLGLCVQELVPPTISQAAGCVVHIDSVGASFDELAADLSNTTLSSDDAATFVLALNDTLSHWQTCLDEMRNAVPLFTALDKKDNENFSLDDISEELDDISESQDGVFDSLKKVLPTDELKAQAKDMQQSAKKDIKATVKAFQPKEA